MVAGKHKETEPLEGNTLSDLTSSHMPCLLKGPPPPIEWWPGTKPLTYDPFGTFNTQAIAH
jgi:hypothetical protein